MAGISVVRAGWADTAARARATSDRELLDILLAAHHELRAAATRRLTELRALLLCGDTTDRTLARGGFSDTIIFRLTRRRPPPEPGLEQVTRAGEIRRLAQVVRDHRTEIAANRDQLAALVNELAPGVTAQPGVGPVTAAKIVLNSTHAGPCSSVTDA
jgi:transposase